MNRLKKIIINTLIVLCLGVATFCGYKVGSFYYDLQKESQKSKEIKQIAQVETAEENTRWIPTKDTWNQMYDFNNDYVGWLLWDNDLISEPLVQGTTNNQYLRTDIYGNYDVWGTIFVEAEAPLTSDNLTIYGHSLAGYSYDTNKFSQLQNMTNQEFYESNKTFKIYWKNHISSYEIFSTMLIDTQTDLWNYQQYSFLNDEDKQEWLNNALSRNTITTNNIPTIDNKFITFQTCHDDWSGNRYIVIAYETETEEYSG